MKPIYRIILAVALVMIAGLDAAAQYTVQAPRPVTVDHVVVTNGDLAGTYSAMPLEVHSGDLFYYSHPGVPLTEAQLREVLSDSEYRTYRESRNLYKTADVLDKVTILTALAGLGGAAGYGFYCWVTSYPADMKVFYGCGVVTGVGLVLATINLPVKGAASRKVKKLAKTHNATIRMEPALSLGFTGNGAGLALNF